MERITKLAYAGAIALLSTGFYACADGDDVQDVSPTYNAETREVTANFVFNIGAGTNNTTRMSGTTVQADGANFRGMQDVSILTFNTNTKLVTDPAAVATKMFDLGRIVGANDIDKNNNSNRVVELALPTQTNTVMFYGKAFKDGNAEDQGVIGGTNGVPTSGTYKVTEKLSDIKFNLTNRFQDSDKEKMKDTQDAIATVLTRIVQNGLHKEGNGQATADGEWKDDATDTEEKDPTANRDLRASFWFPSFDLTSTTDPNAPQILVGGSYRPMTETERNSKKTSITYNGVTADKVWQLTDDKGNVFYNFVNVEKEWKAYGDTYKVEEKRKLMDPLDEILGESYYQFVNIEEGAVRAGSGPAVARTITDLWRVIDKVAEATPTTIDETIAQLVAKRLAIRLETYFKLEANADGTTPTLADNNAIWKEDATVIAELKKFSTQEYDKAVAFNEFPENLKLPMGAAQLVSAEKEGKDEFTYNETINFNLGDGGTTIENIMYPPELMYYGNSPIKTSDKAKLTSEYPNGVTAWDNDSHTLWSGWTTDGEVKSTTRAVAMTRDITYGTALLKTRISCDVDELKDNRASVHNGIYAKEGDDVIKMEATNPKFLLTGILIGGQPEGADWQYLPTNEKFDKVIYDRMIGTVVDGTPKGIGISKGTSAANYTMVLDNVTKKASDEGSPSYAEDNTGENQKDVYVALEFKNNSGQDFWGDHNLVRKGGTFYLVGKLSPKSATNITDTESSKFWPEETDKHRSTPPYKEGKSMDIRRVFIQDFVTDVTFKLGAESLKSAFVTVPDLRSAETSFGLSVDIVWKSGLKFESVLGATE